MAWRIHPDTMIRVWHASFCCWKWEVFTMSTITFADGTKLAVAGQCIGKGKAATKLIAASQASVIRPPA